MNVACKWPMNWRMALLVPILLMPLGCAQAATIVHITGTILGQQLAGTAPNATTSVGIAAQITCDDHKTQANALGVYHLDIPIDDASSNTCTVTAAPNYQPLTTTVSFANAGHYILNFTTNAPTTAPCTGKGAEFDCPTLQLVPGKLVTTIRYQDSQHPVIQAHVRCLPQYAAASGQTGWYFSEADDHGAYTIDALLPGTYSCFAYDPDFVALPIITVHPGQTTTAQATFCEAHCPKLRFHDGVVMHAISIYLIYWLPAGTTFDPAGGSAHYEQATAQFINDVSGTPYDNLLTQYGDFAGPIQNHLTLGGTYVDTQAYPHAGTNADPLTDHDIQNEITRAQQANSTWQAGTDSIFAVFTSYNSAECNLQSCSFNRTTGYCGYHDTISRTSYALILDSSSCDDNGRTPNDGYSDAAIDTLVHEVAETATDPRPFGGWNDDALNSSVDGGEIADLCENAYFATFADGGNITLHGHDYLIQPLWSNQANACAYSG